MVNIKDLTPGMMVKIVDKWDSEEEYVAPYGQMDKWLGQNMTVRAVHDQYVEMEEDIGEYENGWDWFPGMLDCVVEQPANVDFSEEEFLNIICN